jgi:GT2 family glycosyltransferase
VRPRSVVALARRLRATGTEYERYIDRVEPELMARPRVHRFAKAPVIGRQDTRAEPMGVALDSLDGGAEGSAEWAVLVRDGDRLAPQALERLGQAVTLAPDALVISADHDRATGDGERVAPRLHPGPSPDLWSARDPAFAVMAVRRDAARQAVRRGVRTRHRLLLELGGDDGSRHAHVPLVLCHVDRALEPETPSGPQRPAATGQPSLEVIVPFRDQPDLLKRCARSLLAHAAYERLRLRLVDNGSKDPLTADLLARLQRDRRVILDSDPRPFNFSSLANAAAGRSEADVLVFLNNDTETDDADWIQTLLHQAIRPEVGAVAPLLTFPDGRVQHAGVAIGLHGWAGHPFAGLAPDEETPFGAAEVGPRNWLAVTAACMMVERRKFDEVGGFDERFQVGGGDVDLCLRLTRAGYRSLSVPAARVVHDESATRDPAAIPLGDFEASRESYGDFRRLGDPFYHPALSLDETSCQVRTEPGPPDSG